MKKLNFYLKYAGRGVRRGGRLSFFAILCVAVGVAALVALQSLTVSIRNTLTGDIQARAGGDVVANVNFNTSYQYSLSPQAQQLMNKFKSEGRVLDWTGLNSHTVQITGYYNVPPTVYIVDPAHFPLYGNIDLVEPANGNFRQLLSQPNSIIISKSLWQTNGYKLGQQIDVGGVSDFTSPGQNTSKLTIVGVMNPVIPGVNFDTGLFIGFGMISQQTGLTFLDESEVTPTTFFLKTAPRTSSATIVQELQAFNKNSAASFPFFSQVRTATEILGESARNLEPIEAILSYIGLMAVLIGGLGVINTMLVVVGRRTTEIATIKALGLKSRQTLFIFTLEVVMLGALGSLLGMAIGVAVGFGMKGVVEQLFARPLDWGLYPGPLLTGLVVGIVGSAIFGFLPAYAAGRVRPAEVLRQQTSTLPRIGNVPTLLLILAMTVGLGIMAGLLLQNVALGIVIAFVTLLVGLLLVAFMYLVVFLTGKLPTPFGPALKMALRNFSRHRTRTATTLLVITISLFFISLINIVSDTIKTTLRDTFDFNLGFNAAAVNVYSTQDEQLQATFQSKIPGLQKIFISNDVGAFISGINGQPLNSAPALKDTTCGPYIIERFGNLRLKPYIELSGRSLANGQSISPNGPQKVLAGRNFTPADVNKRVLLVSQEEARCYNIKVGDKVTMNLRSNNIAGVSANGINGPVNLEVIGIVSKGTAGTNFEQGFVAPFQLVNQAGAEFSIFFMQIDRAYLKADLDEIQNYLYGNFVFDLTGLIDSFTTLLNQVLAFPLLLSLLSLFSGSILIANNVALAVMERRTEVGVLKALGAKKRRVLSMLLWESSVLGLLGGLIGIGASIGAVSLVPAIVRNINHNINLTIAWSPIGALLLIALGIGLALLATSLSAWRAVQEKPLVVLRYE